jgi:uncharacterized repeat protein (TIGR01451 family)
MIGYRIEVRNTGTADAENVRVIDPVPYGLQYLESTPAGTFLQTDGPQRVEWRLPTLPAGGRETFDVQFRPLDENQVNNVVFAEANNAVRVSNSLPTRIQRPVLGLTVSDPLPPNPQVGQPVRFDIVVENLGSQPLTDVELVDRFEEGLDHVNVKPPSERQLRFPRIERLLPGERQPVPLEFIPNRPGTFCHDVQVTSKEGASDTKRGCVTAIEAQRPSLLVEIQNIPERMTVGQSADVRILIENDGNIDLNNLRIVFEDQQELQVSAISEGTRREGNQWIATTNPYDGGRPISLPQGARLSWPLKVQAMAPARSACTQVTVEGLNVRRSDQHCTEIVPRDETGTAPGSAAPPGTATPPPAGAATPGQERGGLRLYVNYLGTDASGRLLEFEVSLQNTSATPYREIQLQLTAGPGMRIADILGQGARAASGSQDGTQVQLTPIASIRANETVAFRVQVQPGTPASRALLRADATGPELRRTLQAQDFAR